MIKRKLKSIRKKIDALFYNKLEKRHALVGPAKLWKYKQEFQIRFLKSQGLQKTDTLLDLGCGTLRGGVAIIDFLDANNYYGIDIRENVLAEGKEALKEHNLENKKPTLISFKTFDDLYLPEKFDVIFSFSVLIHLEDDIAENYFKFVSNHLLDNGVFYVNVNIGNKNDGKWLEFPIAFRSLEFYKSLCDKNDLNMDIIATLRELGHVTGYDAQDDQVMLKITRK